MKSDSFFPNPRLDRRSFLTKTLGVAGATAAGALRLAGAELPPRDSGEDYLKELEENERKLRSKDARATIGIGDKLKITKVETFMVKPRWLFLKIHTNAGITGLGEPIVEGRAKTVATAIEELTPYLIGKDPRPVAHHWQAMYRHAFYRGGPVLTSAISGVDQALWDIKGKALGVPVYELLGGPTRTRVRAYAHAGTVERIQQRKAEGFTAFKTGPFKERPARIVENKAFIDKAAQRFAELREAVGAECDIAIDFHGALSQQTARLLIKALEPYQPMFIEEPVNCQEVDVMADIARGTHLPIATGERIFTKW